MKLAPPGGLFNEMVVSNLFPHGSAGARKQLVHRAVARRRDQSNMIVNSGTG